MPDDSDRILTTTLVLQAPVQAVYAAWTQPEHMRRWIDPEGSAENGATRMTFRQSTFESVKSRDEHNDARPHLDALRAQVEARPKPAPKKPDA